jgi:hypothetical protein
LAADTVLEIIAQGAWNGGNLVDNSIYENKGCELAFEQEWPQPKMNGSVSWLSRIC